MAKAKDLIALAGLAGLAYANRDKLGFGSKDKDDKRTDARSPGDEMSSAASRKMPDEETRTDARSSGDEMSDIRRDVSSGDEMSKYASNYKPPKVSAPIAAEDVIPTKPLATSAQRTDQLANLSRAVKREAKTKYAATQEPIDPTANNKFYATGQDSDRMKVASRAAAAADRQRKMAKQSAYKSGGITSSASSRADGIATKGKTRGKIC